jgi:hypothetical protein
MQRQRTAFPSVIKVIENGLEQHRAELNTMLSKGLQMLTEEVKPSKKTLSDWRHVVEVTKLC